VKLDEVGEVSMKKIIVGSEASNKNRIGSTNY